MGVIPKGLKTCALEIPGIVWGMQTSMMIGAEKTLRLVLSLQGQGQNQGNQTAIPVKTRYIFWEEKLLLNWHVIISWLYYFYSCNRLLKIFWTK